MARTSIDIVVKPDFAEVAEKLDALAEAFASVAEDLALAVDHLQESE